MSSHHYDEINPEEQLDHAAYHSGVEMDENAPGTGAPTRADLEHAIALAAVRFLGMDPHGMKAIKFRREVHAAFTEHLADGLVLANKGFSSREEDIIRQETQGAMLAQVFGEPPSVPRRPKKGSPPWEGQEWAAKRKAALNEHFRLGFLRFVGLAKGYAPELLAHASLEEIGAAFGGLTRQDVCYHTGKLPGTKGSRGKSKLPFQKQPATVEKCAAAQQGNSSRISGMTPPIAPPKLTPAAPVP